MHADSRGAGRGSPPWLAVGACVAGAAVGAVVGLSLLGCSLGRRRPLGAPWGLARLLRLDVTAMPPVVATWTRSAQPWTGRPPGGRAAVGNGCRPTACSRARRHVRRSGGPAPTA